MKAVLILMNVVLSMAVAAGGIVLLLRDSWTWNSGASELVFSGTSLGLLGLGCLFLAGFVASVTRAWAMGELEMPRTDGLGAHPAYQGQLMVRYWYLFFPCLGCIGGALWLAM